METESEYSFSTKKVMTDGCSSIRTSEVSQQGRIIKEKIDRLKLHHLGRFMTCLLYLTIFFIITCAVLFKVYKDSYTVSFSKNGEQTHRLIWEVIATGHIYKSIMKNKLARNGQIDLLGVKPFNFYQNDLFFYERNQFEAHIFADLDRGDQSNLWVHDAESAYIAPDESVAFLHNNLGMLSLLSLHESFQISSTMNLEKQSFDDLTETETEVNSRNFLSI